MSENIGSLKHISEVRESYSSDIQDLMLKQFQANVFVHLRTAFTIIAIRSRDLDWILEEGRAFNMAVARRGSIRSQLDESMVNAIVWLMEGEPKDG